jgi:GT2 family glycosyltransferase
MITAIFTSCGRFDLLEKTMSSFFKYADMPIERIIVIDNSTLPQTEEAMKQIAVNLKTPFDLIANEENIGQVLSIDTAYSFVDTEYIFHCEDDWEFFDENFLSLSKGLLEERSDIVNVNLRVRFDGEKGSMHPVSDLMTTPSGIKYHEYLLDY